MSWTGVFVDTIPMDIKPKSLTEKVVENIVDTSTGLLYIINHGPSSGYMIKKKDRNDIADKLRMTVEQK